MKQTIKHICGHDQEHCDMPRDPAAAETYAALLETKLCRACRDARKIVEKKAATIKTLEAERARWAYESSPAGIAEKKAREERDAMREKRLLTIKRMIQAELRKRGYAREITTDSGSCYYVNGADKIRVSTHEVPMTPERDYKRSLGCFTWANRAGIVYNPDMTDFEILDAVAAEVDSESFDDLCEELAS